MRREDEEGEREEKEREYNRLLNNESSSLIIC